MRRLTLGFLAATIAFGLAIGIVGVGSFGGHTAEAAKPAGTLSFSVLNTNCASTSGYIQYNYLASGLAGHTAGWAVVIMVRDTSGNVVHITTETKGSADPGAWGNALFCDQSFQLPPDTYTVTADLYRMNPKGKAIGKPLDSVTVPGVFVSAS